jgi:hypothetical protein
VISLRRKDKSAAEPDQIEVVKSGGKGRPTPSRKEALAARPVQPYLKTRATTSNRKERTKDARAERRAAFERQRLALKSGDVANLPPRDRAPERMLARDIVDSRKGGVLQLFPAIAILSLASSAIPDAQVQFLGVTLTMAFFIAAVGDAVLLTRRVRRMVRERFPTSQVKVNAYSVQRAVLPRRFRLPPPRVDRGDTI